MPPQDTLKAIAELVSNKKNADDLLSAVQAVLKIFAELKDANEEERKDILARFTALKSDIEKRVASIKDGVDGKDGRDGAQGPAGESIIGPAGKDGRDGKDGKDGNIKDLSPDEIRNALELLEGEERLDASAIKNLEKYVKEYAPKSNGTNFVISRGAVKMFDLSDQLDGSTKTFALPASSSFPHIMRPTIDYTSDGAAMTLTFTDEIDASTVLNSDQTITLIYAEP
jgi:hypothetical protein